MKIPLLGAGVLALLTAVLLAAPALPIHQAVAVAEQRLKDRGLADKYYISSVTLEPDSLRRATFHWNVVWSSAIPITELKKETGLEIAMDGSVVSVVKGPANKNPTTGEFDPNGPAGLQNHRTRSDRPSILDLKH